MWRNGLLAVILACLGCSSASSTVEAPPEEVKETPATPDTLGGADVVGDDLFQKDDTGGEPGSDADVATVEDPDMGEPCNDNSDCGFGYCIEGPDGKVCTHTCILECPLGWTCKGMNLGGPDQEFICVPNYFDLCEPCDTDQDCGGGPDRCLTLEGQQYCGLGCAGEEACPAGYLCHSVEIQGSTEKQCVPDSGSCSCRLSNQGAKRPCKTTNSNGSCSGFQVCQGKDGWSDCDAIAPVAEVCDGLDNDCDKLVDNGFTDSDGDGDADCIDLDDDEDGILDVDDNCPLIENPGQYDLDGDGDGNACDDDDDGDGDPDDSDCAPLEPLANHFATEVCDAVDNNCNSQVDEGFTDADKDGLANCVDPDDDNDGSPDGDDCDPLNANVFPAALEACDGLDNNCNGKVDEGFKDQDGDGKADCVDEDADADGDPDLTDCAPFNPAIFNGATEVCDGGDNNCNSQVDEGFVDFDQDGQANCVDADDDNDGMVDEDDCAPLDPDMNADAVELCDGIDNNCNGKLDEGFDDTDGDGLADCVDDDDDGDGEPDIIDCGPTDPEINHSAKEICDGKDNNCNGQTDEPGSAGCTFFYKDKDDDGWGMANKSFCLCGPNDEYSATQPGDCDDSTWAINPEGSEVCNNQDDDCDGIKDNPGSLGCKKYYQDLDSDGYGAGESLCLCWGDADHTTQKTGDCDETNPSINPGIAEWCDNVDNNCDGQVDEGVGSTCGNCDPACHEVDIGPEGDEGFALDDENSSGVSLDPDGNLVLDEEEIKLAFIWIANSGENTVSKIDTDNGKEVARFHVCANPSRTAVDLYSDVWAACRNDGGVTKIVAYENNCVDKNKNGIIETSKDLNNDGKIQANEMYGKGQDECVKFITYPGGACQRAAGVDKENYGWVGEWNGSTLRRLHPDDGHVVETISIGCNPYGLVIDGNGIIWVSGRGCNKLIRVDPATKQVTQLTPPSGNLYGITVDEKDRIWLGHYSDYRLSRYDQSTGQWATTTSGLSGRCPRGVTGSLNGYMYYGLGCGGNHWVAKVDMETLGIKFIDLGAGDKTTVGVALDSDGMLWAVNYASSSTTKINTANDQVIGEYPVGAYPYTYSDMTGFAAKNYTAPQGYYQHIIPGASSGPTYWTSLTVDVNTQGASFLKLRLRAAETVSALAQQNWQGPFGPFPPNVFPVDLTTLPDMVGKYLQVEVILVADDDGNSALLKGFSVQYHTDK
jgi:hypothetical protein